MTRVCCLFVVGLLMVGLAGCRSGPDRYEYLIELPQGYAEQPETAWPLMLFLHGAGERGDSLGLVNLHGPPKLIKQGQAFPLIVVSPQCPREHWWSAQTLGMLLDEITAQYRIDEDRIYVTGLSMGGFGTWDLATRYPNRFAAIAPICGGGEPARACPFKHLPVWAFHGAQDEVVPLERSQEMIDALEACGSNARLTVYPEVGHDSWTETYDNPALYDWFLSHRRQPAAN